MSKIFVSIACYKDLELEHTIDSLLNNSSNPEQLRIVVLNQTDYNEPEYLLDYDHPSVEIYNINYKQSKGVSWSRSKIQKLIIDEDYYMQIDAHTRVSKDWDSKLKNYLGKCNSTKAILSYYPAGFENGVFNDYVIKNSIRGLNQKACSSIPIVLDRGLATLYNGDDLPISSDTFAAGFVFAPIEYIKEVPFDHNIFWNYEESDQLYRSFTNGWDIFSVPECFIWHKYNTTGTVNHFQDRTNMTELEMKSNGYAYNKYFNNLTTDYPLGTARSLEEFAILNNIDFKKGTYEQRLDKDILLIVPYRNREENLNTYLDLTPKFLETTGYTYDILICELDQGGEWNLGLVGNSAINFIKKANYKYIYMSHVDVYPIEGTLKLPEANSFYMNLGDYGSFIVATTDFFKVGGFKNTFWGWGWEDNDIYKRLVLAGLQQLDVKEISDYAKYEEKDQNHDRPFNSKNYAHSGKVWNEPINRNVNSIFTVNKVSKTHSLVRVKDHIYRQVVTPLIQSPVEYTSKNVIVSYNRNLQNDDILTFVKSASYYAPNNYEIEIIDVSNPISSNQTWHGFNAKVVQATQQEEDIFFDRWLQYIDFLNTTNYENYLFLDLRDIYLQGNPFIYFNNLTEGVLMSTEGLKIKDQSWNLKVLKNLYSEDVVNFVQEYEILNGGILGGKKEDLLKLFHAIVEEYRRLPEQKPWGCDQPIINKLLYYDQIVRKTVPEIDQSFAINLHVVVAQEETRHKVSIDQDRIVKNENKELFSIVHQYDRNPKMLAEVRNYYHTFYNY